MIKSTIIKQISRKYKPINYYVQSNTRKILGLITNPSPGTRKPNTRNPVQRMYIYVQKETNNKQDINNKGKYGKSPR